MRANATIGQQSFISFAVRMTNLLAVRIQRTACSLIDRSRLAALGEGRWSDTCLVDVKGATEAAAPRAAEAAVPGDAAKRAVLGLQNLSPLGARLIAARLPGKPVAIRALLPRGRS